MGALDLLERIALAGVRLTMIGADSLSAEPAEALTNDLRVLIRENKASLLAALVGRATAIPAATDPCLCDLELKGRAAGEPILSATQFRFPDRDPVETGCSPELTFTNVVAFHPDAIAAEPSSKQPPGNSSLQDSEERSIRAWLDSIGESDPAIRVAVIEQCERDPGVRAYFLGIAPALDDRRYCRECFRLVRGVCTAARRIGAVEGYRPVDNPPRRCEEFGP